MGFWPWTEADPGAPPWRAWAAGWSERGGDPDGWLAFREALTPLAELIASAARWWVLPDAPDVAAASGPVLDWALGEPTLRDRLLVALAGDLRAPERTLEVQAVVAGELAALADHRASLAARIPPLEGPGAALLEGLGASWKTISTAATFKGFAAMALASRWSPEVMTADCAAAAAYLLDDPSFRRAWEVQRWGVAGHPGPLVSHHYIRGLILGALDEAGVDQTEALRALLAELPEHEPPRYYIDWNGIPPDTDSLGLFLDLAARVDGLRPAQVARWTGWLAHNPREHGGVPTWLYCSPTGPATDDPEQLWVGDDCAAVRLVALTGLTAWGALEDNTLASNHALLAERFAQSSHHYPGRYATLLLARYLHASRDSEAPGLDRLRELMAALTRQTLDDQRLDGGWGTPQSTAFALETLAYWGGDAVALARGLRYLSELQRPDGSWEMHDFFLMPAKPPTPDMRYRSAEVTTALCLRAIAAALRQVSG